MEITKFIPAKDKISVWKMDNLKENILQVILKWLELLLKEKCRVEYIIKQEEKTLPYKWKMVLKKENLRYQKSIVVVKIKLKELMNKGLWAEM